MTSGPSAGSEAAPGMLLKLPHAVARAHTTPSCLPPGFTLPSGKSIQGESQFE